MVDAMTGKGREYFGYTTTPLQEGAPPVWLPYTAIDRLVMELTAQSDQVYAEVTMDMQSVCKGSYKRICFNSC